MPEAQSTASVRSAPVRVAVIDSGVQPSHPHIHAPQLEDGAGVVRDGSLQLGAEATLDCLGHGTAVVAAIQQWAPDAMIVPVRVFHSELRASPRALVAAIDWCTAAGVDLVNLSLGTTTEAHRPVLEAAVERALEAGLVLLAAGEAGNVACFPGALPGALGVGLDWNCPRGSWRLGEAGSRAQFVASGHPRPIPGVPSVRNLYGVSFAVANMTGFAAALMGRHRALPLGRERLSWVRECLREEAAAPA